MPYSIAAKQWPEKKFSDDRLVRSFNGRVHTLGVCDGSKSPVGSDLTVKILERHSRKNEPPALEFSLQRAHRAIRRRRPFVELPEMAHFARNEVRLGLPARVAWSEARKRVVVGPTTAALIRMVFDDEADPKMSYAVAGDSSIMVVDRTGENDNGPLVITNPNRGDDCSDFVGSSYYSGPGQIGELVLPRLATIGIFSDGTNHWRQDAPSLEEILASNMPTRDKVSAVGEAVTGADHTSAIIIDYPSFLPQA